jgi:hypothetical protein
VRKRNSRDEALDERRESAGSRVDALADLLGNPVCSKNLADVIVGE